MVEATEASQDLIVPALICCVRSIGLSTFKRSDTIAAMVRPRCFSSSIACDHEVRRKIAVIRGSRQTPA
jgi:hypothetical protein